MALKFGSGLTAESAEKFAYMPFVLFGHLHNKAVDDIQSLVMTWEAVKSTEGHNP